MLTPMFYGPGGFWLCKRYYFWRLAAGPVSAQTLPEKPMKAFPLKYAMKYATDYATVLVAAGLLFAACDTGQKIDSRKVAEEMRSRKLKRVTAARLIENTLAEGKQITRQLDSTLLECLQTALAQRGIVRAAAVCNPEALSAGLLEKTYAVRIRRLALHAGGGQPALTEKQRQIWEAYRYNAQQNLPMEANVQRDGPDHLLCTTPVLLANTTCLKCHGKVGKDLTDKDFRLLRAAYPAMDSLSNHAAGQPIGIWNLLFDKAPLVLRMEGK